MTKIIKFTLKKYKKLIFSSLKIYQHKKVNKYFKQKQKGVYQKSTAKPTPRNCFHCTFAPASSYSPSISEGSDVFTSSSYFK